MLLEASAIGKRFGGVQALTEVSFSIRRGEIYGLIGPNGAGKTSLFNVLTGIYTPDSGHFTFDGAPLDHLKPNQVAERGIARTFQNIRLFQNLSALENVMIGRHVRTSAGVFGAIFRDRRTLAEEAGIEARSYELLDYVGVADRANDLAKHLAYGDQRRLEIARALATEPKLLALDEPAAGMNATETKALKALLDDIRRDGTTILLIEHDMKLVMSICDRVLVLDYGKRSPRARPRRYSPIPRSSPPISAAKSRSNCAGPESAWPRTRSSSSRASRLPMAASQAVKGIDLVVRERELVCLIGANGAGKTTTLKGITGLQPVKSGSIHYDGQNITGKPAFQLVRRGLSMVPEGRGVFGALTIEENLAMGAYTRSDRAAIRSDIDRVYGCFRA